MGTETVVGTMADALDDFEDAFSDSSGGCRRRCECGREFYNSDGGWTWEEGELDELSRSGATDLPYSVGLLAFEGRLVVPDCDCWQERAKRLIVFITNHDDAIATFLTLRKKRMVNAAARLPVVSDATR